MNKRIKTLIGIMAVVFVFTTAVRADANYAITLSNGVNYAVFTLTFTGDVTGLQITSPEGYIFNEGNAGAAYKVSTGKIQIGVRYAEPGKWKILVYGSPDDGFRILVASNSSYGDFAEGVLPPPTPTPTATPTPTVTPTPTSTPTPKPSPTPTVTLKPTASVTPTPTSGPTPPGETVTPTPKGTTPSGTSTQPISESSNTNPADGTGEPTLVGPVDPGDPSHTDPGEPAVEATRQEPQKGLAGIPVLNLIEDVVENTPWLTMPMVAIGLSGSLVLSFLISYAITRHRQTKKYISQEWSEINYEENEK